MKSFVYILQSSKNGSYYIGSTSDIERRVAQHNNGEVKATLYKRPYELVFQQEFSFITVAREVENTLKKWKRRDFLDKIVEEGIIKKFLGR